jgi:hypothetical protein
MNQAVDIAFKLHTDGYHKQIVNRILEPFAHIKVVCTSTEWVNFFNLRLHEDSQPEIQALADSMSTVMRQSEPKELKLGEWHIPYVKEDENMSWDDAIKCSVARCARVSYLNHDNSNPDIEKDISLHDKLVASKPRHGSPAEHQATPMMIPKDYVITRLEKGETHISKNGDKWSGNLRGFVQYRQLLEAV